MIAQRIAVIGAGAWGTALANVIARAGRAVTLWARDPAVADAIMAKRESPRLPGVRIDERVALAALSGGTPSGRPDGDAILVVVPAQALREAVCDLAGAVAPGTPVVACAKGIERGTGRFMTEIIAQCLPAAIPAILSGPSFAGDVARGLPTAVTLAAPDEATAKMLAHSLGSATFRPYHSTDVRGVEIGGAAKNVLAIAAGIVSGRKLGASAAAALTTRGFAELVRFGRAYGARAETLTGLSGLGDLILTCSSAQSRNFRLGRMLGEGRSLDEVGRAGQLAEGIFTASVLVEMAKAEQVETPIAAAVAAVLDGTLGIDEAIEALLTRPFRAEG
jgi:glycerol-3-phosphate dehydrogenase (NAD(P)+)